MGDNYNRFITTVPYNIIKYNISYCTAIKRRGRYFILLLSNKLNPNTQKTDDNNNIIMQSTAVIGSCGHYDYIIKRR